MLLLLGETPIYSGSRDNLNQFREGRLNPSSIKVNLNEYIDSTMTLINQMW